MSESPVADMSYDDARAKRAVAILFWAQAVVGAMMPVHFILGGLVGQTLSDDPNLATLPISSTVLVTMMAAPLMSALMGRWGRRIGFLAGAAAGAAAMALATYAISIKSFELFVAAGALLGVYMGAHGFYRFAAADMASPEFRPKAISWVLAGGLAAALIGPEIVKRFGDHIELIPYAGAYRAMAVVVVIGMIPLLFLDIPRPKRNAQTGGRGRPWREILADRRVVVAMFCAMVVYALMNLMMTSTPLAMLACGFDTADAADVVRVHVFLMFAPSFFTGNLINRFGAHRIMALGLAILAVCAVVAMAGISLIHFNIALGLLGIGWNFGFIGATAMLADAHRPEERSRVQGLNDFLIFGLVTIASFSSGALMVNFGWEAVNAAALPVLAVAAATLAWLAMKERAEKPA